MGYQESSRKCVVYGKGAWKLQALTRSRLQGQHPHWHLISCKREGSSGQEQRGWVVAVVLTQHLSGIC